MQRMSSEAKDTACLTGSKMFLNNMNSWGLNKTHKEKSGSSQTSLILYVNHNYIL